MDFNSIDLLKILALTSIHTFALIEFVTPLALKLGLVDRPNKVRKHHVGDVPLAGGIAVFVSAVISSVFWLGADAFKFESYFLASSLVVFVGILDDKYDLSVRARLVGQILISFLIVVGAQTSLAYFGDIIGIGNIDLGVIPSFFITVLAVLAVINAFNMLDGMDGLLGSVSIVPLMAVGFLFAGSGKGHLAIIAFVISSAIVPFLMYNIGIPRNTLTKIFLGDAGSMFLGLSVVYFMLRGTQDELAAFRPVTALWLVAIPLMDLAAVTIRRMCRGNSIFDADKEHLHHVLMRAGFGRKHILIIVMVCSLLFALFGILGERLGVAEYMMFGVYLLSFAGYSYIVHGRFRQRKVLLILGASMNLTPKLAR